jgi:peptidyl-prolyl cis-trans isomerase B (cyclophilin B)
MTMALPNHVQPDVQAVAGEIPMPLLGVTVAWTWFVIAGLSSLVIQWLRLDTYALWQVRIPEAIVQVLLVALVPLLLTPIPSLFRTRAIALFASAGILWVAISIGTNVLWDLLALVTITDVRAVLWSAVWALTFQIIPVGVSVLLGGLAKAVDPDAVALRRTSYEPRFDNRSLGMGRGTNGLAIASMVLGLVGGSVLAVVFGHVARSQIRRTGEDGDGLAVAGLVLGYIGLAASLAAVVFIFFSSMR